jgi:amino acid transporter
MVLSLIILLVVTILAVMWARKLAAKRGRHVNGWALATALFPPVVLILWALPRRSVVSKA